MRAFKIILTLIVLIAGFWLAKDFLPANRENNPVVTQKEIYTCPMHPQIIRDKPGDCPICHMKLVKKIDASTEKSHNHGSESLDGYAPVTLNDNQRRLVGIRTSVASRKPLVKTVRAFGYVASNIEMYQIQNEFVNAYIEYVNTFKDYRRIKDRRRTWEIHRELQTRLLEAHNKLLQLGLSEAEVLKLQNINRWQVWNQPQLELFKDNPNYWIVAEVAEDEIGFIDAAQKAAVLISSFHETLEGIVRSVGGAVDPQSRRVRVLIELPQFHGELIANMFASVSMPVELDESLLVPQEAVMDLGARKVVFVEKLPGVFEPREIEAAWQADGFWSVDKGLSEGDHVVVDGNFLLDSESRLRANFMSAAEPSMAGGMTHDH